jgi:hypothetical protein
MWWLKVSDMLLEAEPSLLRLTPCINDEIITTRCGLGSSLNFQYLKTHTQFQNFGFEN